MPSLQCCRVKNAQVIESNDTTAVVLVPLLDIYDQLIGTMHVSMVNDQCTAYFEEAGK